MGSGMANTGDEICAENTTDATTPLPDTMEVVLSTGGTTVQTVNLWSLGATSGAFCGLLICLIFFNPLLGVAVGAGAGALSDYGINDTFKKDVSDVLQPGQEAQFMMVRQHASDRVIERLGDMGGRIIRTNLDTSKQATLRDAFDAAHKEAVNSTAADVV